MKGLYIFFLGHYKKNVAPFFFVFLLFSSSCAFYLKEEEKKKNIYGMDRKGLGYLL